MGGPVSLVEVFLSVLQVTSKFPRRQFVEAGALVLRILGSSIVSQLPSHCNVSFEHEIALKYTVKFCY